MLPYEDHSYRARESTEHVVVKLDDPDHPLNRPFGGQGFEHVGEFFRVSDPYSRDRVRVLFSIDNAKTALPPAGHMRADDDYALAWTRSYGRGRVVYCTIGHSPQDFLDLQVWFNLTWFDPLFKDGDPFLKGLIAKGGRDCPAILSEMQKLFALHPSASVE